MRISSGRILAIILALLVLAAPVSAAKTSVKQQRSRLSRIQELIRRQQSRLFHIKKKENSARQKLYRTRDALDRTRYELDQVSNRLTRVVSELTAVRTQLDQARARTEKYKQELEGRMVSIYKYGRVSYFEVILGARDFASFLNRMNFLRLVMRQDHSVLQEFVRQKQALADAERQVVAKENEVRQLKTQVRQKERVYRAQAWAQGATLKDIRAQRAQYEQQLAELEANSRQIERMIRRMMVTPRGRQRSSVVWRGNFRMPVSGRITSGYGYRIHPIFKTRRLHTGVDIAVPTGTPVRAAAGGEVIFTGRWGGYGIVVIVDHGGGVSTLYAHNSAVAVRSGQHVGQGQVVSYSGSTGYSTGPHLHFEVRRNGVPVNPLGR